LAGKRLPKGGKIPLFGLQPIGLLARRAKRGEGRFFGACQFNFETLYNSSAIPACRQAGMPTLHWPH